MVILRIHEKGHYVELPGISPVRTPVEIDITKLSLPIVAAKLISMNIEKWEIVSESRTGERITYKKQDFIQKSEKTETDFQKFVKLIDSRFAKFEVHIKALERQIQEKDNKDKEQNNVNQSLKNIENLIKGIKPTKIVVDELPSSSKFDDEFDEEYDKFIPEISADNLRMSGEASIQKQDKDDGVDDAAEMLSQISKKRRT